MTTTDAIPPELAASAADAARLLQSCTRRMTTPEIQACQRILAGLADQDDLVSLRFLRPMLARDAEKIQLTTAAQSA